MWLVSKPISCFCYEQGNPADVSTIPGMLARISGRKPFALTWTGEHNLSWFCSSRTLKFALFLGSKYLVILQSLWGKLVQQDFEMDQPYMPCRNEKLEWQKRAFSFSFHRGKVGGAIISNATGILFKYSKSTALKILLLS